MNDNQNKPIYVAYAEDHDILRGTLIDYLEKLDGIKVIIDVDNGLELLEQINRSAIKPDVCLIDIVMPKMNGFETVAALKTRWPDMKVLVLSGHLSEDYLTRMILCGADGYLTKKTKPKEMQKAIQDIHEYGLYNTELFTAKFVSEVRSKKVELPELTGIELQMLKYSILDLTFREIGELMSISEKSAEGHRARLYVKLGVKTRAGIAMYAVRKGYHPIDVGISPL